MVQRKVCKKCLANKILDEYYPHPLTRDRRLDKCKECVKEIRREHRLKPKFREKIHEYDRKRNKLKKRRRMSLECKRKRIKKNPVQFKSQVALWNARNQGRLTPGPCWVCGSIQKIHGHHYDYDKPLEVIWLCHDHHVDIHRQIRELKIEL